MVKCKTKAIQIDLGRFRHNQAYSKPCVNWAVVYPEPWHIQNQKHIQNHCIFRNPVNLKLWHIQNARLIQTSAMSNIYDQAFCENSQSKKVSQYKFTAFSTSWNKYQEVVTPEIKKKNIKTVFCFLCKKSYGTRGCRRP